MTMTTNTAGRNAAAIGLIGLGVLFLAAQITGFSFLSMLWPFSIIVPGVIFLYFAFSNDHKAAGLAVPGAMITGTGAILFYQNLTGHWESWAYIWALYPVFLGLALVFIGRRTASESTERTGDAFVKWGLFAFIGLWALFELFIFSGSSPLLSMLIPLIFIGAGIYMLTRGPRTKSKTTYYSNGYRKRKSPSEELQEKIDAALAEDDDLI